MAKNKGKVYMIRHQVKQLILTGADKEPYEKGISIINPKKTIALLKAE